MIAQGAEHVPWAENTTSGEKQEAAAKPPHRLALQINKQFRAAAKAIIQTLAPSPEQRRKRREETKRGFKMARALTVKITRSILHYLYLPSPYDREQERAEAEKFLRRQIEEWTHDDQPEQDDGSFHYGRAAGIDPQP